MSIIKTGISRRTFLGTAAAGAATLAMPAITRAQTNVLRISTWGGKWAELLNSPGSAVEKFTKLTGATVEMDNAFPFLPKLLASPAGDPIYDMFHDGPSQQWAARKAGHTVEQIDTGKLSNFNDLHTFASSPLVAGIAPFTSVLGIGYRNDQNITPPKSWKDLMSPDFADRRGWFKLPISDFGVGAFLMLGKVYGSGLQDLDAAFKAFETIQPLKWYEYGSTMEKALLQGEIHVGALLDGEIWRHKDVGAPLDFSSPEEGVISIEQVMSVAKGSQRQELAYAWIDTLLDPEVQKIQAEGMWYNTANKNAPVTGKYAEKLYTTAEQMATLIQVDWDWYNQQRDAVNAKVGEITGG
jgi:putative spermidine/putrescine transport system substrate-binding protein